MKLPSVLLALGLSSLATANLSDCKTGEATLEMTEQVYDTHVEGYKNQPVLSMMCPTSGEADSVDIYSYMPLNWCYVNSNHELKLGSYGYAFDSYPFTDQNDKYIMKRALEDLTHEDGIMYCNGVKAQFSY